MRTAANQFAAVLVLFPRTLAGLVFFGQCVDRLPRVMSQSSTFPLWLNILAAVATAAVTAYLVYRGALVVREENRQ